MKRELGYIPKVGWQLDPFGHSASQATLMTSRMGFDSIFFGRIDYQDLKLRQSNEDCEGLWNASQSLHDTTVFWGLSGSKLVLTSKTITLEDIHGGQGGQMCTCCLICLVLEFLQNQI